MAAGCENPQLAHLTLALYSAQRLLNVRLCCRCLAAIVFLLAW